MRNLLRYLYFVALDSQYGVSNPFKGIFSRDLIECLACRSLVHSLKTSERYHFMSKRYRAKGIGDD